jgi:BCD family chlorophyll transporter-like MFS transporter
MHITQTVGLALATDLAPPESQPKVVGLMYVMLLFGAIGSSLLFGALLVDFTPPRLVGVIQGCAVATMVLNIAALWKQEPRKPRRSQPLPAREPGFAEAWAHFCQGPDAVRHLVAVGIGTMGFGMADIVLEPYGGQVLNLTVSATTRLTAALAIGSLIGFAWASRILTRGFDALRLAAIGALLGLPAFAAVIAAAPLDSAPLFVAGTLLIGFGTGLFAHGTLTASMNRAPREQVGLALGAWGAIQASAAGLAVAMSGVIRDGVTAAASGVELPLGMSTAASGYTAVYLLESLLLGATVFALLPFLRRGLRGAAPPAIPDASPAAVKGL